MSRALADRADLAALTHDATLSSPLRAAAFAALVAIDPPPPEVFTASVQLLATPTSPLELRWVAVQALARSQHPDAEAHLIACLGDPDDTLVAHAIDGLGAVGTAAAVPPLRALAVHRARAKAAMTSIQARIGPAGALAVAEADGGLALSALQD